MAKVKKLDEVFTSLDLSKLKCVNILPKNYEFVADGAHVISGIPVTHETDVLRLIKELEVGQLLLIHNHPDMINVTLIDVDIACTYLDDQDLSKVLCGDHVAVHQAATSNEIDLKEAFVSLKIEES